MKQIKTFDIFSKYPQLKKISFQNSMLRWENTAFVTGGGEEILDTVIAGLKPYGNLVESEENIDRFNEKAVGKGLETWVQKANENSVTYRYNKTLNMPERYRKCELHVSQKGTLTENFELVALIRTYDLISKALKLEILSERDKQKIIRLKDTKLIDVFKSFGIIDCENPIWNLERVMVGLVFGYPIESTVIFIKNKIV